ncbi:MAG: hypothetical protein ACE5FE_10255, partial [Acidiferrobacterales bacterium]
GQANAGINLDGTQVVEVAAFMRVINALENIRASIALLEQSNRSKRKRAKELIGLAVADTKDGIGVLVGGGLHPQAVAHLKKAKHLARRAVRSSRRRHAAAAIRELEQAQGEMIE